MVEKRNTPPHCPCWSSSTRYCYLARGGIFLPVREHVDLFCEGREYRSCPHYDGGLGENPSADGIFSPEGNRRRFPRLPGRYGFCLVEPSGDELEHVLDDSAVSVDVSAGGIRFESSRALPVGMDVLFSLNDAYMDLPIQGRGRVCWCRSLDTVPRYHAGVSVDDPAVTRALFQAGAGGPF